MGERTTMKLYFEDIGKLKKAEVELNGITVICGDNNTGKSTVGKVLFCIFNSCYKIDENILKQISIKLYVDVRDIIRSELRTKLSDSNQFTLDYFQKKILNYSVSEFIEFVQKLSDDCKVGINQIDEFLFLHLSLNYYKLISKSIDTKKEIYDLIKGTFKTPIDSYKVSRIKNFFDGVFDKQLINVKNKNALVSAIIKGKEFRAKFNTKGDMNFTLNFDFNNKAFFIDSPYEYKASLQDWNIEDSSLEHNSLYGLVEELLNSQYVDYLDVQRRIIEDRLDKFDNVIDKAVKGTLRRNDEKMDGFQFEGFDVPINISNLSTGVKSLLLLRVLCKSGKIAEHDVLILDEPEIHLHPEWQIVYAEAVVLLQRELNLTVLITSHSPSFVRAIECYCDYYDRMSLLDVYKTKKISDFEYTLENLSYMEYGVSELYDEFSKPYSKLDKMLEDKYNQGG